MEKSNFWVVSIVAVVAIVAMAAFSIVNSASEKVSGLATKEVCIETDGGEDFFEAGRTAGQWSGGKYSDIQDTCLKDMADPGYFEGDQFTVDNLVYEYWCDNDGYLKVESYVCPNGCENGACIRENIRV
ncbi:MAG: hypothetical protein PHG05_01060 [Candidatus Nanoarchaeia archaeon]|nr:hypothetical protein [Candidatus Nanoarchaeia archaeon]